MFMVNLFLIKTHEFKILEVFHMPFFPCLCDPLKKEKNYALKNVFINLLVKKHYLKVIVNFIYVSKLNNTFEFVFKHYNRKELYVENLTPPIYEHFGPFFCTKISENIGTVKIVMDMG